MRYVVVDGLDGVGKTTLINNIINRLVERSVPIHKTRAIGGTGDCPYQMAIRNTVLSNKFPHDKGVLEEGLFALAHIECNRQVQEFLDSNPNGVAIKDRGVASNVSYGHGRGFSYDDIMSIHDDPFSLEKRVFSRHGGINLVLLPNKIDLVMERIERRAKETGVATQGRLETLEIQESVFNTMSRLDEIEGLEGLSFHKVYVDELDSPEDVYQMARAVLFSEGLTLLE